MSLYSSIHSQEPGGAIFLRSLPIFQGLRLEQINLISERVQRRAFAPGIILFHQDMPGLMLYMIESGWVRIFAEGRTGQEFTLNIIGSGEIFGELSLLDKKHHSATAITLSRTVIWMLPRNELEDMLEQYPSVARALIHILVSRIRSVINHAEAITFQDIQGRLAYELLRLAERHGKISGEELEIAVPLTQADLATLVGSTRESVNKALSHLKAQGMVRLNGGNSMSVNPVGLRRIVFERGR